MKKFRFLLLAILVSIFSTGSAMAYTMPYNIVSLQAEMSGGVGTFLGAGDTWDTYSAYSFTGVGSEAANRNSFVDARTSTDVDIYNNWQGSNPMGYNYGIWSDYIAWNDVHFDDLTNGPTGSHNVLAYMLDEDWTLGAKTWDAGLIIIGFGDKAGDGDFDDLIVAANPVPEPATMILFGLGLLGLAGVSRKK